MSTGPRALFGALLATGALVLAGCSGIAGAAGSTAADQARVGALLVQQRCERCHTIDRIQAASHDRAGWESTVARMIGKGAQLSDTEKDAVIQYLSGGQ